jgi:hypothetical protein
MRTTFLFLSLVAAITIACDSDGAKSAAVGSANGLLDDESSPDTGEEIDYDVEPGDGERLPLQVEWITDGDDTAATSMILFQVVNTTDRVQEISVALVGICPLGEAELQLGDTVLGPGDVVSYDVHSDELPIRSTAFLTKLSVKLTRTTNMIDHPEQVSRQYSGPLYRHESGFESARAFSSAKLSDELDGVLMLTQTPSEDATVTNLADTELGEMADGEGGWVALKPSSKPGMVAYDGSGNVIGVVTGYSVGTGDASGEGAIVTPEPEETEVADE